MDQIGIEQIAPAVYRVFSVHSKESIAMTTEGLAELVHWAREHLGEAEPTIIDCPYCYGMHEASNVEMCPLNPNRKVIP